MKSTAIKTSAIEVVDALAELGLTTEILIEAIRRGEIGRDSCTANDAPCAPGYYAWNGTVRALRELLLPKGWTRNDDACYSRVINPDRSMAIAVVTGDDGTGNEHASPKTKYPKGAATQAAISSNQYFLFGESLAVEDEVPENLITWMLLKKRVGDSVFAELSLPSSMMDGQVESWETRIILEPILIEPNVEFEDDSSEAPIDVLVRRRS